MLVVCLDQLEINQKRRQNIPKGQGESMGKRGLTDTPFGLGICTAPQEHLRTLTPSHDHTSFRLEAKRGKTLVI